VNVKKGKKPTDTTKMQSKNAAVMIGRMSPPTLGHYRVINAMKKFIRENPEFALEATPIVVIIDGKETGKDKQKNPLSAKDRIEFMMASGKANGVKFMIADSAYNAWEQVRKAGYEPIAIAAGSDRIDKYIDMLNTYFKDPEGKEIKRVKVPGLARDQDSSDSKAATDNLKDVQAGGELDIAEVSGTMARTAVQMGYEEAFSKIVGLEHKPKLAKIMFNKIKKSLEE